MCHFYDSNTTHLTSLHWLVSGSKQITSRLVKKRRLGIAKQQGMSWETHQIAVSPIASNCEGENADGDYQIR